MNLSLTAEVHRISVLEKTHATIMKWKLHNFLIAYLISFIKYFIITFFVEYPVKTT